MELLINLELHPFSKKEYNTILTVNKTANDFLQRALQEVYAKELSPSYYEEIPLTNGDTMYKMKMEMESMIVLTKSIELFKMLLEVEETFGQ